MQNMMQQQAQQMPQAQLSSMGNNPLTSPMSASQFNNLSPQGQAIMRMTFPKMMDQTPEQKFQQALALAQEKADITRRSQGGTIPTRAVATQSQQVVQSIKNLMPTLDDLISGKHVPGILNFSPNARANYLGETGKIIDQLLTAYSLPKTDQSQKLIEDQIRRQRFETVENYLNRIKSMKNDLLGRYATAAKAINTANIDTPNIVNEKPNYSALPDTQLVKVSTPTGIQVMTLAQAKQLGAQE
jgi:hypothetical protein